MQDRPDLEELLGAVRGFLETEVLPAVGDQRLKFRVRVAAHVLAVLAREAHLGPDLLAAEGARLGALLGPLARSATSTDPRVEVRRLNELLAGGIREGTLDAQPGSPVWQHLVATAREKLQISNPPRSPRT